MSAVPTLSFKKAYSDILNELKQSQIPSPQLEADWLFEFYCGLKPKDRFLNSNKPISADKIELIKSACQRRALGEPLAYIIGECEFLGQRFVVDNRVLIPRPETELLVEWAISWCKREQRILSVLDLGAGSGCVGLSILKHFQGARLTLVDISAAALCVTKINAQNLNVADRAQFLELDAKELKTSRVKFDLVTANPPYIARDDIEVERHVKQFEPSTALFSGVSGLEHLNEWVQLLPQVLLPKGAAVFEIGYQQGAAVYKMFQDTKLFSRVQIHKDYSGHDRFVSGEF